MSPDDIRLRIMELNEREYERVRTLHPHFTEVELKVAVEDNLARDFGSVGKTLRHAIYEEADKVGGKQLLDAVRGADIPDNSLPTPEAMLLLQMHAGEAALTNAFDLAESYCDASLQQERPSTPRPGLWLSLRDLFSRGRRYDR